MLSGRSSFNNTITFDETANKERGTEAKLFRDKIKQSNSFARLAKVFDKYKSREKKDCKVLFNQYLAILKKNFSQTCHFKGKKNAGFKSFSGSTKEEKNSKFSKYDYKSKGNSFHSHKDIKVKKNYSNYCKPKDIFEQRELSKQFQATVTTGKNYISFTFNDFH